MFATRSVIRPKSFPPTSPYLRSLPAVARPLKLRLSSAKIQIFLRHQIEDSCASQHYKRRNGRSARDRRNHDPTNQTLHTLVVVTLALSGLARAQWDDDDYYRRGDGVEVRQHGYQNGYRDGVKQGRHEGRENDPQDFRVPDAGQASRGYRDWMGPIWIYQNAYRDGYRAGFGAGYNNESRT